eukprot:1573918-Amphidinium_carterae.1
MNLSLSSSSLPRVQDMRWVGRMYKVCCVRQAQVSNVCFIPTIWSLGVPLNMAHSRIPPCSQWLVWALYALEFTVIGENETKPAQALWSSSC